MAYNFKGVSTKGVKCYIDYTDKQVYGDNISAPVHVIQAASLDDIKSGKALPQSCDTLIGYHDPSQKDDQGNPLWKAKSSVGTKAIQDLPGGYDYVSDSGKTHHVKPFDCDVRFGKVRAKTEDGWANTNQSGVFIKSGSVKATSVADFGPDTVHANQEKLYAGRAVAKAQREATAAEKAAAKPAAKKASRKPAAKAKAKAEALPETKQAEDSGLELGE